MAYMTVLACLVALAVPASAQTNYKMWFCNKANINFMDSVDMDRFKDFWYLTHTSYEAKPSFYAAGFWVNPTDPMDFDKRGNEQVDFSVFQLHVQPSSYGQCSTNNYLYQHIGGVHSSPYSTTYNQGTGSNPAGYYVEYYNYYLLNTDYDTTAVMYVEKVLNGRTHVTADEIQIWQRQHQRQGQNLDSVARAVVDPALSACSGGMATPSDPQFFYRTPSAISELNCQMAG